MSFLLTVTCQRCLGNGRLVELRGANAYDCPGCCGTGVGIHWRCAQCDQAIALVAGVSLPELKRQLDAHRRSLCAPLKGGSQ